MKKLLVLVVLFVSGLASADRTGFPVGYIPGAGGFSWHHYYDSIRLQPHLNVAHRPEVQALHLSRDYGIQFRTAKNFVALINSESPMRTDRGEIGRNIRTTGFAPLVDLEMPSYESIHAFAMANGESDNAIENVIQGYIRDMQEDSSN